MTAQELLLKVADKFESRETPWMHSLDGPATDDAECAWTAIVRFSPDSTTVREATLERHSFEGPIFRWNDNPAATLTEVIFALRVAGGACTVNNMNEGACVDAR